MSFAAAAVGSLLAPAAGRAAGGSVVLVSAVTSVLAAGTIAAFAAGAGPRPRGRGVLGFYLLNAAAWPLRKQLMHDQTTSSQRSTTVSASSLALMVGGLLGNLLLPRLADLRRAPGSACWPAPAPCCSSPRLVARSGPRARTGRGAGRSDRRPVRRDPPG